MYDGTLTIVKHAVEEGCRRYKACCHALLGSYTSQDMSSKTTQDHSRLPLKSIVNIQSVIISESPLLPPIPLCALLMIDSVTIDTANTAAWHRVPYL